MSEKRFVQCEIEYGFANTTNIKKADGIYDMQEKNSYRIEQIVDLLNEQDKEIDELEKNFDDIVEWTSKIAKRNVILDEQIGQLQRENEQLRQEVIIYKKAFQEQVQRCTL